MIILMLVLGAVIGSFLNVVIYRLPLEESPIRGRSKCPSCGATIRFYDNVPIVSYVILGGKCRIQECKGKIPLWYPVVELLSALVLAINFHLYGLSLTFVWSSSFLLLLLPMAFIDAQHYILPDELTWGGFILGIILSLAGGPVTFKQAIIGSVVGGGILLLVSIIGSAVLKKQVMGEGDVKMMAMIGAYLGWNSVFLTIFLGSALGTLIWGSLNLIKKEKSLVPFGVFLAAGGFASMYFGNTLFRYYLDLFW
jgi:leader peptidase (prepilin peptidase)/N-methyltransferase